MTTSTRFDYFVYSQKTDIRKASLYFFKTSSVSTAIFTEGGYCKPTPDSQMIKHFPFDNLFHHYDILAKTHSRMTIATRFSCQDDAGSHVHTTYYWANLILVVTLILKSKSLYFSKVYNSGWLVDKISTIFIFLQVNSQYRYQGSFVKMALSLCK